MIFEVSCLTTQLGMAIIKANGITSVSSSVRMSEIKC